MTDSRLHSQSREVSQSKVSRRNLLKSAALGSAAVIAAPYVKGAYAAGSLSLGVWDHWVPGANNTLTKLCNEWGAKNNCQVTIDYITSQGEKDKLTAAAEAQAGTGHDIMSHRDWNIRIHQDGARAARRRRRQAHQAIRADQPGRRISRQDQGHLARPTDDGRQPGQAVLLALRSLPAACRHRRARHVPRRRVEMGQGQDRQLELGYLSRRRPRSSTRPASRSACRWDRRATPSTGSARCSTPSAWSWSTARTTSRSTPTRPARPWNISRS